MQKGAYNVIAVWLDVLEVCQQLFTIHHGHQLKYWIAGVMHENVLIKELQRSGSSQSNNSAMTMRIPYDSKRTPCNHVL